MLTALLTSRYGSVQQGKRRVKATFLTQVVIEIRHGRWHQTDDTISAAAAA